MARRQHPISELKQPKTKHLGVICSCHCHVNLFLWIVMQYFYLADRKYCIPWERISVGIKYIVTLRPF